MAYSMEVEGSAALVGASGAATMTTTYDDHGQPAEVLIHNAAHLLLRRMIYTRDSAGRLVREEVHLGEGPVFPDFEDRMKDLPAEDRERLEAAVRNILSQENGLSTTTYFYDEKGRQVERIMRMGLLSDHRTTFHFDDHDNPIEELSEENSRDMGIDEQGYPQPSSETSHKQHTRYSYKYDAKGNWTERVVWSLEPNQDPQPSNIERRQISYYQAASERR